MNVERFRQLLRKVADEVSADREATTAEHVISSLLKARIANLDATKTGVLLQDFEDAAKRLQARIRAELIRARGR